MMYGVQGRTWVALGDPVGPPDRIGTLIRLFLERCDDYGGVPVFYEVGKDQLHHYADFGLTFVKLGEEARVDLAGVLARGRAARRSTGRRSGISRRPAPPFASSNRAEVPAIMDQLRAVSDDVAAGEIGPRKRAFRSGSSIPSTSRGVRSRWSSSTARSSAFANIWPGRSSSSCRST